MRDLVSPLVLALEHANPHLTLNPETRNRRTCCGFLEYGLFRKADVRLPEKGNSRSHGARPVHLIIKMIQWFRASRLSIKDSFTVGFCNPDSFIPVREIRIPHKRVPVQATPCLRRI